MEENSKSHCNISGSEIQKRLYVGYLGLFLTLICLVLIFIYKLPPYIIFPFLFVSAIGFIQARVRYCVYFGLIDLLKDPDKYKNELVYIFKIFLYSFSISVFFTLILTLITSLV